MDLNKPATVKQVMLIVWGPALVAAIIWLVLIGFAADRTQKKIDAGFNREATLRHQAALDALNETAPLGASDSQR